jgi:predicted glycosyltransferase
MARKRKTTRKAPTRRRSRSMGAATTGMLAEIGGLAAGAILAKQLNKMLKFDARILAAGKVVLGVALPKFVKNPMIKSVGQGMIAVGATELVGSFVPALAGADDVIVLNGLDEIGEFDEISGMDISEVNGMDDISEVNGIDEIGEVEVF